MSLNLFMATPTHGKLTSMHFYAWKIQAEDRVLLSSNEPAVDAIKVTVPVEITAKRLLDSKRRIPTKSGGGCLMCSA